MKLQHIWELQMSDDNQPYKTKAAIFRILGNENVPRDIPGKRLAGLKQILEKEPQFENTQKWFMVNRIFDTQYRRQVCEVLDQYNAHYITVEFNRKCKAELHSVSTLGIDINKARNSCIEAGHFLSDYAVVLDGDCIFSQDAWDAVYADIQENKFMHLSIPMKRENVERLVECQLAFRYDSPYKFDEAIPFGQGEKLALLYLLGHDRNPTTNHLPVTGDLTKLSGYVDHITTGDEILEEFVVARGQSRSESLHNFVAKVSSTPQMEFNIRGSLGDFYNSVPGHGYFWELYSSFALDLPDNSHIVEIGSWLGRSALFMATWFKAIGKRVRIDCVDTWEGGEDPVILKSIAQLGGTETVFSTFMSNLYKSQLQDIINPVKCSSVEAAKHYPDNSLDAVFIDADHTYEAVLADIQAWYPKVKVGGIITGHDFSFNPAFPYPGVAKAVLEFFKDKPLEILINSDVWKSVKYAEGDSKARKRKWL